MPRFSQVFLDELRSRISIEELISEYTQLKPKGRQLWARCPFHGEKTASFAVYPDTQHYYCYGCHRGGNALSFVQEIERMEFVDAVKYLAERAHMEIPDNTPGTDRNYASTEERELIYKANVEAARYYHGLLWQETGAEILAYFYKRGLNDSDIRRFGLGASPKDRIGLKTYLEEKGFALDTLLKAGLVKQNEDGVRDMFRDRAMFPIINAQGKVLGFGGRAMGEAQPKYLNTSDTPIFNKRNGLYAMNFVREERDISRFVLVEGYMDTVSLRKYGVKGVFATLGTALTVEQAKLFKRYVHEVWISYDGDKAGQKAALRALEIFDGIDDLKVYVLDYPNGQDPDDFIRSYGLEGFEKLPRYDATQYRMLRLKDDLDISTQEGMTSYAIGACAILKKIKEPVVLENRLRDLVKETGYDREILLRQIGTSSIVSEPKISERRNIIKPADDNGNKGYQSERLLLTLLAGGMIDSDLIKAEDFDDPVHRRVAECILSGNSIDTLLDAADSSEERSAVMQSVSYSPIDEDPDKAVSLAKSSLANIRKERLQKKMSEIQEKIAIAPANEKADLYRQMASITSALEE